MKKRLLFLAAFAAAPVLFAGCEGDTVGEPSPTSDDPVTPAECVGKMDDPSCHVALPGEDAMSSDTEGSQPDTAPSEPQKPAKNYDGEYCPNKGCVLAPTALECPDCWDRWDCIPDGTTGMPTVGIPQLCGF